MTIHAATVVLPTRDRPDLLTRALGCVFRQRGVDLEVIVVDDGSSPPLSDHIEALRDPRVTLLRHEVPRGVATARNAGIACARHPYVAFLDDDDLWSPEKLSRQLHVQAEADAGFSYTGVLTVDAALQPMVAYRPSVSGSLRQALRRANVIGGPSSVVVSTVLVRRLGGFDDRLSVLADWELWMRLADHTTAVVVDEALTAYVVHEKSMHVHSAGSIRAELDLIRKVHPGTPAVGGRDFWRWFSLAQRRSGRRLAAARALAVLGLRYRGARDLARAAGLLLGERAMLALGGEPVHRPPRMPDWLRELAQEDAETSWARTGPASSADARPDRR